ncbi:MAG: TonB-dependent receptor [Bryobacteraceae bacterium]|nr:TonB-dependent receptor [Bryobacteraceae bacterium]
MTTSRGSVRRASGVVWCLLVAGFLALQPAEAQHPVGQVRIEVKDPSGAVVVAAGKLENLSAGTVQRFATDAEGIYSFTGLLPGRYRLAVTATGFATRTTTLDVQSEAPMTRTINLSLGAQTAQVDVVGTTPLPGSNLSALETPLPVKAGNSRDIENSGALNLSDFLNKRLTGVYLNEVQGNPFQPDLNYRGYTASPLLGTPQGLSIYMDGVRLNQPFGDVVSWDLIPKFAVAEVSLIPGSNPLFGLNTLGGALSLETKDGRGRDHSEITFTGGSYGRKIGELEHGGSNARGLSWYAATNLLFEDGWRDHSPSNVRQFFVRLGWQNSNTSVGLTGFYANNSLIGNGLQEQRLLWADYNSVYTIPDKTANLTPSFNLMARHRIGKVQLSGNVYQRYIRTNTLNGDLNDDSLDQSVYQPSAAERAALTAAGYTGFPTAGEAAANAPFPKWRCIAQGLLRDEPAEKCNGLLNRSHIDQHNGGFSMQGTWFETTGLWRNQFTAGAAFDHSSVGFQQLSELGYLNRDRSVTGVGAFGDGVTGGDVDGEPFDTRVNIDGRIKTGSFYGTDTVSARNWNFTFSGRYNHTAVDNRDRIRPAGEESLTAKHTFSRFNPAAGVTYSPTGALNLYFSYSEGSRAPTSVELGCANPSVPCKLPNAMAGDPPLLQVVARTFEAGVRSGPESRVVWSAGWFRAQNSSDILFVSATASGYGYFRNFGRTRRQGLETDIRSQIGRVSAGGGYTFLDATYQSAESVNGAGNSTNTRALTGARGLEGEIRISPGNRIPLTPRHLLKAYADIRVTKKLNVDINFIAVSSSLARGNENNRHQPDGVYYVGPGRSGGYSVISPAARYRVNKYVEVFAQVNNLLNHRYYTAAQLGATGITPQGSFLARPFPAVSGEFPLVNSTFLAPGAPIGAWGGLRLSF